MTFVPFANTAQIEMVFSQSGQIVENVFHVEKGSPYDADDLAIAAATFVDWWDTEMQALIPDNVSLNVVRARALDTESGVAIEYTTSLPLVGGNGSNTMPNNVTFAIKWSTGLAGRSYRGRTYHIGVEPSNLVDPNHLSSSAVTGFTAAYSALLTSFTDPDEHLVVASRVNGGAPRVTGVTTEITAATINPTLDSQRRRLPERGS